uniref:Uncharacterized protein n=1 Tax=viral metagenome TaxID=1070528 RepID=A0A6H1ZY76_9ZZZZ
MNFFGVDLLQLIVYISVAGSFIVVLYILKLTRKKEEPESETTTQLITLLDKYVSHQLGLKPGLHSNPSSSRRRKPQSFPSIVKIDEETHTPSRQAEKLMEKIRQKVEGE